HEARTRPAIAGHRKQVQPDREKLHEDKAEPEARYARCEHGNRCCSLIHKGATPISRINSDRQSNDACNQKRKNCQKERRLGSVEQCCAHWHVEEYRLAEIALQQLTYVVKVLNDQRLIET